MSNNLSSAAHIEPVAIRAPRLATRIRDTREVTEADALEFFRLYELYYAGTCFDLFRRDLAEKTYVIELRSEGILRGFSTAQLIPFNFDGAPNRAIFSGDTIIDSAFWGEQALVDAFCNLAGQIKARRPTSPLYWFLICKGYRTYRYLSVFAKDYFPHPTQPTPDSIRLRLEYLARGKFQDAYSAATGLIRFSQSKGHLREQWAQVAGHLCEHTVVKFFLERNPDYHAGDELACLTELKVDNLRSFAKRAFIAGLNASAAPYRSE
jgi:hypothetical protein